MCMERTIGEPDSRNLRYGNWSLSLWATLAAFGTYFCMYGFRKPFTAASYDGFSVGGLGYKEAAVTAQVIGYMLSKFFGVKIISEMKPERRATAVIVLIAMAQGALLLFAVVPPPWNVLCSLPEWIAFGNGVWTGPGLSGGSPSHRSPDRGIVCQLHSGGRRGEDRRRSTTRAPGARLLDAFFRGLDISSAAVVLRMDAATDSSA